MAVALMDKAAGQAKLPETPAVVALFAFGSRLDRDTMQLFARTHSEEVRAAAIASTGQEVLELLHGGLRPQVLVLDALLTKPAVTQVLQEIGKMDLKPQPAVLVLVPVPEETAARRALGLFSRYEIMLRPYGMKNLFDEIYRMGTDEEENRLYRLRRCCEDVLESLGAPTTLNGYRYAERMLLYALYADKPQPIGVLQQYVATEEDIEVGTVTSALNRLSAGMAQLVRDMQTQLLGARRLGDQASDAATAAVLHSTCVPRPIDLLSQLDEICDILREEAARYDLPFTIELQTAGQSVLPTVGDAALLNGLMTNLISNTLSADAGACITLHCEPGLFCYRDNGPGLPPDAKALLTDGCWSARLLYAGGLGLPLIAAYTKAMGWSLAVGPGPGTELRFTLPPAPPLDDLMLESPMERMAERQTRRLALRRELAVLRAQELL